jgi:hypothetical protein
MEMQTAKAILMQVILLPDIKDALSVLFVDSHPWI